MMNRLKTHGNGLIFDFWVFFGMLVCLAQKDCLKSLKMG
jgi:hypothetical protein